MNANKQCFICHKTFTLTANLQRHMKSHDANKPTFSCSYCNASKFSRNDSFLRHQKECRARKKDPQSLDGTQSSKALSSTEVSTSTQYLNRYSSNPWKNNDLLTILFSNNNVSSRIIPDLAGTSSYGRAKRALFVPNALQLSPPIPPQGDSPLNFNSPYRNEFYACGIWYFTQVYPLFHVPTHNLNPVHPFMREAIILNGACCVRSTPEQEREGDTYVLKVLRSDLRDKIFREFMETSNDNIHLQSVLLAAFILIQIGAWTHKDVVERRVMDGYHPMVIAMARKSGIPSMIYKLRTSIACMDLSCPNHGEWMRWVHYEYMKRIMHILFIFDSRRGDMCNTPPCLLDKDLDEMGFFLPSDGRLWVASSYQQWYFRARSSTRMSILGLPIRVAVETFLTNPETKDTSLTDFDTFAGLIIISGIIHAVNVYFNSSRHEQQRYNIKRALDAWCKQRMTSDDSSPLEYLNLYTYMQTLYIHEDPTRLVSQAERNYERFNAWLVEIPDVDVGDKKIKGACTTSS